jgi:MgtC family
LRDSQLEWWEVLVRLGVAAGPTGPIGLERELRERAAGLRTHMLVGIGSALFTIVSAYGWTDFGFSTASGVVFDPTRIAAQVVTGIGFLSAGDHPAGPGGAWADDRGQPLDRRGDRDGRGRRLLLRGPDRHRHHAGRPGAVPLAGRRDDRGALPPDRRELEIDLTPERTIAEPLGVIDQRRVRVTRVQFEDVRDRRRLRVELDLRLGPLEGH